MRRKRCIVSNRARRDLNGILNCIGKDDPESAVAFVDRLESTFKRLIRFPHLGRVREELGPGIRGYPIERYVVLYRTTDAGVEIVHVLHGARDIETMFDKERL